MSTTEPIRNAEKLKNFKEYYRKEKPQMRNYLMIVTGLNTALRISDILKLRRSDVWDYERHCFKEHLTVRERKTGKINVIFINEELRTALSDCLTNADDKEDFWLFSSQMQREKPLSRHQAFRIVKEAARCSGLSQNISCHSLRKTFGYYAWKQGTPPAVLMNIFNHSSFAITKRYLGIDQDDKDEVYKKICI